MFRFQRQDLIAHRQTPSWYQLNILEFKVQPQQVARLIFRSSLHAFGSICYECSDSEQGLILDTTVTLH